MADDVAKEAIARQLRKSSEAPAAAAAAAPAPKAKTGGKAGKFAPTEVFADGTLLFSAADLKAAK
jgi:type IV secretory pathway VirB9-like protein